MKRWYIRVNVGSRHDPDTILIEIFNGTQEDADERAFQYASDFWGPGIKVTSGGQIAFLGSDLGDAVAAQVSECRVPLLMDLDK